MGLFVVLVNMQKLCQGPTSPLKCKRASPVPKKQDLHFQNITVKKTLVKIYGSHTEPWLWHWAGVPATFVAFPGNIDFDVPWGAPVVSIIAYIAHEDKTFHIESGLIDNVFL